MRQRFPGDQNSVRAARMPNSRITPIGKSEFQSQGERRAERSAQLRGNLTQSNSQESDKAHHTAVARALKYLRECKAKNVEPNPNKVSKKTRETIKRLKLVI